MNIKRQVTYSFRRLTKYILKSLIFIIEDHRLGRVLGVPIELDSSFVIYFSLLLFFTWHAKGWQNTFWLATNLIAVFVCVLTHEFGHILAARDYGIKCKKVVLHMFGGAAMLERIPTEPRKECWVTIGGLLVTVVLTICFAYAGITSLVHSQQLTLIGFLFVVNAIMLCFNLLPMLPLDGGRLYRATLCHILGDHEKASKIAMWTTMVLAPIVAIGIWRYFSDFLALILMPLVMLMAWMEVRGAKWANRSDEDRLRDVINEALPDAEPEYKEQLFHAVINSRKETEEAA